MTDSFGELERLVLEARPKLHRYCARMTGSVIDGEDVVQDALVKAMEAWDATGPVANPEGWLYRIAHNAALDFLRRRARHEHVHLEVDLDVAAAPANAVPDHQVAAAGLRTFMRLPVAQRSTVILRDVLGYSVQEVSEVLGATVPAVKSALQRGRLRLRELAHEREDIHAPLLSASDQRRLMNYVERFNARDFDAIRSMLTDDVRLDLVNRLRASGKAEVSEYFHRYSLSTDWRCVAGFVDGRPAILIVDPEDESGGPVYFVLLDWADDRVVTIRDFRFARYALDGADIKSLG